MSVHNSKRSNECTLIISAKIVMMIIFWRWFYSLNWQKSHISHQDLLLKPLFRILEDISIKKSMVNIEKFYHWFLDWYVDQLWDNGYSIEHLFQITRTLFKILERAMWFTKKKLFLPGLILVQRWLSHSSEGTNKLSAYSIDSNANKLFVRSLVCDVQDEIDRSLLV